MDPKQFEAMLNDAEIRLRRLKTLYDQWFMGIERTEPAVPKKELEDLLAKLKREQVNNTAAKFRLQQVVQRHLTFVTYWRRIARQIEEGTFKRDLVRARKQKKRGGDDDADLNYEIDVEVDADMDMDMDMDAALAEAAEASERAAALAKATAAAKAAAPPAAKAPGAPPPPMAAGAKPAGPAAPKVAPPVPAGAPAPASAKRVPPPPPSAAGAPAAPKPAAAPKPPPKPQPAGGAALSNEDVQRIYANYVAARKQNAERTDNVKFDNIEKTLRGMLPQLEKKHAGKKIDFEVVVKDGKVALKPVAK
jgi:hypothetical protein